MAETSAEESTLPPKRAFLGFKTPIGNLEVSGANLTLNTILTLAVLVTLAWLGAWIYLHKEDLNAGRVQTNKILESHDDTQKKMISAIKENTCILSLAPEKREAEFTSPNSLCKRMTQ